MLDDLISRKIKIISFVAMVAVVAWHCECGAEVERWFIPWVTHWSVPWFFAVSGFFFVKTAERVSIIEFFRKKTKTLLVPYLFWCAFGWSLWQPEVVGWGGSIFGLSSSTFPSGNLPMWYVRALIVFMVGGILVYPICLRVNNLWMRFALFALVVIGVRLFFHSYHVAISPGSSVYYFLLGCVIAIWKVDLRTDMKSNRSRAIMCAAAFLSATLIRSVFVSHVMLNISIVFMLIAIWWFVDIVVKSQCLNGLVELTSGIYFVHDPFRRMFDKYFAQDIYCALSTWQLNMYYFIRIVVLFAFAASLVYALKRFIPRFSIVVFGGR